MTEGVTALENATGHRVPAGLLMTAMMAAASVGLPLGVLPLEGEALAAFTSTADLSNHSHSVSSDEPPPLEVFVPAGAELDSPAFEPKALQEFKARDFGRKNRWA